MVDNRLQGFDEYMEKLLEDWNAPGVGVGIVEGQKLISAKGYGFRDYGKKLLFTPQTLFQIASNTKVFTAVAAGMLVEEGRLTWDKPVRDSVPTIQFHDDYLNNTITLRDMLAHRTGISRHDMIWYKSDFTRRELFERLRYLEPREPLRQTFLYNNLMYAAAGYLIEMLSGKTWEEFICERIFGPLDMNATVNSVAEMVQQNDHAVPFTEKRDSTEIHRIPHYEDTAGIAPAGAIISSIEDMSHWLVALMNDGRYRERQVIPQNVLKATLEPAIALPNTEGETRGFWELLNEVYCMGRMSASYRGHLLTRHGGSIGGFQSEVSFMPQEKTGVIVFVVGSHCDVLRDIVSYNAYERLLDMDQTPWSERYLEIRKKSKKAGTEARAKAGGGRVPGTSPSHALKDYVAEYGHPAYGTLKITMQNEQLQFEFHKIQLPLGHFHYDRFDTSDDELHGKWAVNFLTNPLGDIDKTVMSLDEAEATFTRNPEIVDADLLKQLAGTYGTPDGSLVRIVLKDDGSLCFVAGYGVPEDRLIPYKGLTFRVARYSDSVLDFILEKGQVNALKIVVPSGEYVCERQ